MDDTERVRRELGLALRHLRSERKAQQKALARKARIGPAQLSSYENGRSTPTFQVVVRILEALEADFHDLHNALYIVRGQFHRVCTQERQVARASGREAVHIEDLVRGLEALLREVSR